MRQEGALKERRKHAPRRRLEGKEGACARIRVAAVRITVSVAIRLQALGIPADTHVPGLGTVCTERYPSACVCRKCSGAQRCARYSYYRH